MADEIRTALSKKGPVCARPRVLRTSKGCCAHFPGGGSRAGLCLESPHHSQHRPGRECRVRWGAGAHLPGSGETEAGKEGPRSWSSQRLPRNISPPTPHSTEQTMPTTAPPSRSGSQPGQVSPLGEQEGDGCLGGSVSHGGGPPRRLRKSSGLGGGEQGAPRHHCRPQGHPPREAPGAWHPADSHSTSVRQFRFPSPLVRTLKTSLGRSLL